MRRPATGRPASRRNSLTLPARNNVDLRLSRVIPIGGSVKAEVIGELKNVFNVVQWAGVNSTVTTDTLGNPLATDSRPRARDSPPTSGYEQRQFQLGFRVSF